MIDDLPLFNATPTPAPQKTAPSEVEARLKVIMPDDLSPKDALNLIYELRGLVKP